MIPWKDPEYILVEDMAGLQQAFDECKLAIEKDTPVAIDTETTGCFEESGLNPYQGWLLGISIACSKKRGYYIPLNHIDENNQRRANQITIEQFRELFNPLFSTGGLYLGHNFKFDYKFLWKSGIHMYPRIWDTMIAMQMMNGNSSKGAKLKSIISDWVSIPSSIVQTFEDVAGNMASKVLPLEMLTYAVNDAVYTQYLYEAFKPIIDANFHNLFYNAEMPTLPILAQMEMRGFCVDPEYMQNIGEDIVTYKTKIKDFLQNKYNVSVSSPKQLASLFAEKFPDVHMSQTPGGQPSTDANALKLIKESNPKNSEIHKLAKRVLVYRNLDKLYGTYIYKFPKIAEQIYTSDKTLYIVHTNYTQMVNSGRESSSPNVQNIPREGKIDVRKGFIPRPGYTFVGGDYAGQELRITAVVANETKMIEAFLNKQDLHRLTAQGLFGVSDPTEAQRFAGKTFNFSILYGATKWKISKTLRCSLEEAEELILKFFQTYPGLAQWKADSEEFLIKNGYTETFFGRRRYPTSPIYKGMLKNKEGWKKYQAVVREQINHIVQGTGADILKFTKPKLVKAFAERDLDSYIVNNTHDDILVETSRPQETLALMKSVMAFDLKGLELPVDLQIKTSFSKKDKVEDFIEVVSSAA